MAQVRVVVGPLDRQPAQQIRIDGVLLGALAQVRAGINRLQAHRLHVPRHRLVINQHPILLKLSGDFAHTVEWAGGVDFVDPLLDEQRPLIGWAWGTVHP
jgi:hypothetical protein